MSTRHTIGVGQQPDDASDSEHPTSLRPFPAGKAGGPPRRFGASDRAINVGEFASDRSPRLVNGCLSELAFNTPMVRLSSANIPRVALFAKLELQNITGSIKDRAASFILDHLLERGEISRSTRIVESSSGNLGIALSAACKARGLQFTCVIDPFIQPVNEFIIRELGGRLVKVTRPDAFGGYLSTRIETVHDICAATPDSYWVNQYGNPLNAQAYYETLGPELCGGVERLDYVFIGVSSGGTITGVSRRVKERFPDAKVIAVDMRGSVIFGGTPRKRPIPGIGSSMVPSILAEASIDDVVLVDERDTILGCRELLSSHSLFCGGSSGAVFSATEKYFGIRPAEHNVNVAIILPDRGDRYIDTIYNAAWAAEYLNAQR